MRRVDQLLQQLFGIGLGGSPAFFDLPRMRRPVPVEAAELVESIGGEPFAVRVLLDRTQPEQVHTKVGEIAFVDRVDDTLEIATLVVGDFGNALDGPVGFVGVAEAVREHEVHDRVLPNERLVFDPERDVGRLFLALPSLGVRRPNMDRVFAVRKACRLHGDQPGIGIDNRVKLDVSHGNS